MSRVVHNEENCGCPECGGMFVGDDGGIDIGDGYLYDICGGVIGCGFKRKRKKIDGHGEAQN